MTKHVHFSQGLRNSSPILVIYAVEDFLINARRKFFIKYTRIREVEENITQEIEVYFNFIGRFVPPQFTKEPTPEELEEQAKIKARKDRLHQNYLRRKENGKYQAYAEHRRWFLYSVYDISRQGLT